MSENDNDFIPTFTYVQDLAQPNQIKTEKKDSIIHNKINKKEIEKDNEFIPIG